MISSVLDYTKNNGLVYCKKFEGVKNEAEKLYISNIKDLSPYAVLFRRYYNEGEKHPYHSEPAVCIFSEEKIPFNSEKHKELHAALWSEGKSDIYIIHGESRIDIFNARKPAEVEKKMVEG